VTYVENVESVAGDKATLLRRIDGGVEKVEAPLPLLITVTGSAAPCRPCNAKRVMKYKRATAPIERTADMPYADEYDKKPYLTLTQWGAADIDADLQQCGMAGSPTKVKAVQNIVFKAKESKRLTAADAEVEGLIKELLENHTIG
jgi:electron transfer flavoprotein beta subunit